MNEADPPIRKRGMIAPRFADITPYGLPPLPLSTIVASPRRRMAMIVGLIVALVIVGWFLVHMITAYMQRTPLGVPGRQADGRDVAGRPHDAGSGPADGGGTGGRSG